MSSTKQSQNIFLDWLNFILQPLNKNNFESPYKNYQNYCHENWLLISYIQSLEENSTKMTKNNMNNNNISQTVHDITNLNLSINKNDSDLFEYLLEEELNDLELGETCAVTESSPDDDEKYAPNLADLSPDDYNKIEYLLEEEEQDDFTFLTISEEGPNIDFTEADLNLDEMETLVAPLNGSKTLRNFDLNLNLSTILEVEEFDAGDFRPLSTSTPRKSPESSPSRLRGK